MFSKAPKLMGGDFELGNFILGDPAQSKTGSRASRLLLRQIRGFPVSSRESQTSEGGPSSSWGSTRAGRQHHQSAPPAFNPQDWGRQFLADNGGCIYIDLDHLELCVPEVLSAYDHLAAYHAMIRMARRATREAAGELSPGESIHVLVNNSDGLGNSYGGHLSFLLTRQAWNNILQRKIQYALFLAAYQVSSIIFTGQGKVGCERLNATADFQLSQRADFFHGITGSQTTFNRPIINGRDEPLCGSLRAPQGGGRLDPSANLARLHVIFYDSNLSHVAHFLKVGVMQIILAMIEQEYADFNLILEDPVSALHHWSADPSLQARAGLINGGVTTALELQCAFLDRAKRFADQGGLSGIVPDYEKILSLWEDTLTKLASGNLEELARRLDWALKKWVLMRAFEKNPSLTWQSPEVKHLDQIFGNVLPEEGLYWRFAESGFSDTLVSEERIGQLMTSPPEDTRAWTRAMLLRLAEPAEIDDVDWDLVSIRTGRTTWEISLSRLELSDPLAGRSSPLGAALAANTPLETILRNYGEADRRAIAFRNSWSYGTHGYGWNWSSGAIR